MLCFSSNGLPAVVIFDVWGRYRKGSLPKLLATVQSRRYDKVGMRVNSLLVSRDQQVQSTVADVFAGIDLALRDDTIAALELISRSHFDGFVIDCDGMERGTEIISAIRNSRANRQSVIFTLLNGKTSVGLATELGSNFVLGKSVEPNRLTTYLRSSVHKMETEHRRYFRYQLTLDAVLICRDGKTVAAQVLNVSDGGVALRLLDKARLHGSVTLRFMIPGQKKMLITAFAAVAWSTERI